MLPGGAGCVRALRACDERCRRKVSNYVTTLTTTTLLKWVREVWIDLQCWLSQWREDYNLFGLCSELRKLINIRNREKNQSDVARYLSRIAVKRSMENWMKFSTQIR